MGSKGIRRRKPAHQLAPVRTRLPDQNDLVPPNIMWPASGSGFQADPFSPAGSAQRGWWLIGPLWRRDAGAKKLIVVPALAFLAFSIGESIYHLVNSL